MLIAENSNDVLLAPPNLDTGSRIDFRRSALEHLERVAQRSDARFVIDLRNTVAIDATGLGILVLVQKRARERKLVTALRHAPASVKHMLALTKLAYLFEIAD